MFLPVTFGLPSLQNRFKFIEISDKVKINTHADRLANMVGHSPILFFDLDRLAKGMDLNFLANFRWEGRIDELSRHP